MMEMPIYKPPDELREVCKLHEIRLDDVLKILLDMPVKDEEAFQIVESLTNVDTAIEFYSRNEIKAERARKSIFHRISKTIANHADDESMRNSFIVLKELYRMEAEGVPIDEMKLKEFAKIYERQSTKAVEILTSTAKDSGIVVSKEEIHSRTFSFPDEYAELNDELKCVRKEIKHANMLNLQRLEKSIRYEADGSARLITHWDIFAALSGRIHSSDFNTQGLPKHVREQCIVPKEGYSLICADYASEELILIAVLTEDQNLLDNIMNGYDLHKLVASRLFAKDIEAVTEIERKLAKNVSFAYLYGAGDTALKRIIFGNGFDVPTADVKKAINSIFINVKSTSKQIGEVGYVELINGKRISLEDIPKRHSVFNRMVQGSGAVILKAVIASLVEQLPSLARICFLLHDEVSVEAPIEYEKDVIRIVEEVMAGVLRNYGYSISMPVTITSRRGGEHNGINVH